MRVFNLDGWYRIAGDLGFGEIEAEQFEEELAAHAGVSAARRGALRVDVASASPTGERFDIHPRGLDHRHMPGPSSVEEGLVDLVAHHRPLDSLSLMYRGLSVFHRGGEDIDLARCRVSITQQRQDEQARWQAQLSTDTLQALVGLLREHETWVQREPERLAVPDETRATLSIEIDGAKSTIWEWYPGRRIREVHGFLMKMAPPPLRENPSASD